MSEPIRFTVRHDPRPIMLDSRHLIRPCDDPPVSEEMKAFRDELITLIARRLAIPSWIVREADSCFSSASLNRGDAMSSRAAALHGYRLLQVMFAARWQEIVDREFVLSMFEGYWRRRRIYAGRVFPEQITLYLQTHRRLPGSNRTARLRKKRTTIIHRYCDRLHRNLRRKAS